LRVAPPRTFDLVVERSPSRGLSARRRERLNDVRHCGYRVFYGAMKTLSCAIQSPS